MNINIKTSEANKIVVTELTRKLFPQGGPENVIARIALAYSLASGVQLDPNKDYGDTRGKEYKEDILFGPYRNYYVALICQHYGLYKTDLNIPKYVKMHIDNGLQKLSEHFNENKTSTGLDFLIDQVERGIEPLTEITLGSVKNNNQNVTKKHFEGAVTLQMGRTRDTQEPIRVVINDKNIRNNAHLAVAGNSGTGKTQFALDLLRQFAEGSEHTINFLYLDFKGLKKEDVAELQPFFERTKTTFIDAPQKPFPLNPLTFIDNVNEKNRLMGVSKFVDIITSYAPKMGATQVQFLKDATRQAFSQKKGGEYPTLKDVAACLFEITGGKPDTLTQIISSLSEYELFAENAPTGKESFLNKNYYFSLSGDLDKTIRFTATFLTIYYIYNTFMNMENAPVNGDYQTLRYVLLIDEAHVLFKDKKSQGLLEVILREIRSKGVVVVLLSQGIEEFNQPSFDFSSMCENAVLLDIKDKANVKIMQKFLGLPDKEVSTLVRSMEVIGKGQAVANFKEFKKGELFDVNQFWKVNQK